MGSGRSNAGVHGAKAAPEWLWQCALTLALSCNSVVMLFVACIAGAVQAGVYEAVVLWVAVLLAGLVLLNVWAVGPWWRRPRAGVVLTVALDGGLLLVVALACVQTGRWHDTVLLAIIPL